MSTEIETLETWTKRVKKNSAVLRAYYSSIKLDDSFGWGGRVQMLCRQSVQERPSGLLLTGMPGCGKHTAAAFAMEALAEEGYGFVFLEGSDLKAGDAGIGIVKERINGFLDEYYDLGQGLCLIIEEPGKADCAGEFLTFLGMTLAEYRLQADELPPLFAVLISEEEMTLPAILRSQLQRCRMALPDLEHRKEFLKNRAKDIRHSVSLELVAELTERYSYAQLEDLVSNLILLIDSDEYGVVSPDTVAAFILDQQPEAKAEQVQMEMNEKVSALLDNFTLQESCEKLADHFGEFLEALPELMQKASTVNVVSTSPFDTHVNPLALQEQKVISQGGLINPDDVKKVAEEMPVSQLAIELFGQEQYDQIMQKYS